MKDTITDYLKQIGLELVRELQVGESQFLLYESKVPFKDAGTLVILKNGKFQVFTKNPVIEQAITHGSKK